MVIGQNVAGTFDRLYYFERACETYIKALWTGGSCGCLAMRSPKELPEHSKNALILARICVYYAKSSIAKN